MFSINLFLTVVAMLSVVEATYIFYEGNRCLQDVVGNQDSSVNFRINFKDNGHFQNDEARSVLLQGPIQAGKTLWVCDHPTNCGKDDETKIEILQNIANGLSKCISTFERSYTDDFVKVQYHKKNGLDGKVSQIKSV